MPEGLCRKKERKGAEQAHSCILLVVPANSVPLPYKERVAFT